MVKAWYLDTGDIKEQQINGDNVITSIDLKTLYEKSGVEYYKIENLYNDELLENIKQERNYNYEDEINISREGLKDFDKMVKNFYTEHLHEDEEIRLVLDGSGFFDVRDINDKWVRIEVIPGDLLILPGGIYHRFSLGAEEYVKLTRLFVNEPIWTAHNRPEADNLECRKLYINKLKY
uniref:Acireductone dioxygenase n=1 Tax=Clastoptera arizonana TaxID=38151 RepID=A0A1B6DA26_9HEMI